MLNPIANKPKGLVLAIAIIVLVTPFLAVAAFAAGPAVTDKDRGLTLTVNGDHFYKGDEITISGSVDKRNPDSNVWIQVIDPKSHMVEEEFIDITADNTFTFTFTAGEEPDQYSSTQAMTESGNYRVKAQYQEPGASLSSSHYFLRADVVFAYTNTEAPPATATTTAASEQQPQLTPSAPQPVPEPQTAATEPSASSSSSSSSGAQLFLRSPGAVGGGNNQTLSLAAARHQYLLAWNRTAFSSQFNTYIQEGSAGGYGVYREHVPTNFFRPGETIVLYVEPVGFGHKPIRNATTTGNDIGGAINNDTTNGATNNTVLYLTNLTADIIISDTNGNELQAIRNVPAETSISHRQNTELFLTLTLRQDRQSFPIGKYNITYVIYDQVSQQSFPIEKIITIGNNAVANTTAVRPVATASNTNNGAQPSTQQEPQQPQSQGSSLVGGGSGGGGDGDLSRCDSSYPDVCIPPPPPNLNCDDISARNFRVVGSDPHGFDGDNDGIGCEDESSQGSSGSGSSDSGDSGDSGSDNSSGGGSDSGDSGDSGSGDTSSQS
ncbi:MAG: excalibur calcium-binding domain-containing protein [Thermoproteota archaeon]|nr:excalibur calcium-binding domain-containing protein [Thermoproteota archaeon]